MYRQKHFVCILATLTFFIFMCLSIGAFAAQSAQFTLRVGYWPDYGTAVDPVGRPYGYTCDYFNEIAKINDWQVQYIACDWNNGLTMLSNGEIDVFGPMQKTSERQQQFSYPDYAMGFEYGTLYVRKNNQEIYFNDLQSLDGKTVGTPSDSFYITPLKQFCQKNGITLQFKDINDAQELEHALHDGTIDLLLAGSMLMPPEAKSALYFAPQEFYYATTNGNSVVLNGINSALEQIRRKNIYFDAELYNKYYVNTSLKNETFTKSEKEYIRNAPPIQIAYFGEQSPFEFYDDETGELRGITPDILNVISQYSGLTFEFTSLQDADQLSELLASGSVQMVSAITDGKNLETLYPLVTTDPLLKAELNFVLKQGSTFDETALVLALPKNWVTVQNHMRTYYPIKELKLYDTTEQCLDAVLRGDADLTVQNRLMSETSLKPYKYRQLTINSMRWGETGIRMGILPEDTQLLSIMNKSIASLNTQELNEIIYQHTIRMPYVPSFSDKLRFNAPIFAFVTCAFLLALCLFSLRYQRILNKLAFSDPLTGEMNLNRFKIKVKDQLNRSSDNAVFALLSLDIDKFKSINNLYGYAFGDSLIQAVAHALHNTMPENGVLCRDIADRFFLFFPYSGEESFSVWFEQIVEQINTAIAKNMPECRVVLSGGVCLVQSLDKNITPLLDQANLARQKVKNYHQSSFAFYQQAMYDKINNMRSLENDMASALENEEFVVYLQPKIALNSGHVAGAEALVRWMRPGKGLVPPDSFIPLFEQNGFVVNLDFYVLEQVCKMLERWKQEGRPLFPISVNFSRRHLFRTDTVSCLTRIMASYDVSPSLIELELTESAFDNCNIPVITELFHMLHQHGFSVSVDDFGVGYSSLSLLKDLPIDALKIDKSFFDRPQNSVAGVERSEILLASVINLSEQLNIRTISEGVETEQQVMLLQRLGCDLVQGFYFARPMPIPQLEELLQLQTLIVES